METSAPDVIICGELLIDFVATEAGATIENDGTANQTRLR